MRLSITVPRKMPSLNEVIGMHWGEKKQLKQGWRADAYHLLGNKNVKLLLAHKDLQHRCKVSIHSERQGKRWQLDKDNLYGGAKIVLDAVKEYFVDDSEKWIDLEVTQAKGPTPQTTIQIETLEAAGCNTPAVVEGIR